MKRRHRIGHAAELVEEMHVRKTTPDGMFTVTIRSEILDDPNEEISDESLHQLVQLLEQTAQLFRLSIDPDLERKPEDVGRTRKKHAKRAKRRL